MSSETEPLLIDLVSDSSSEDILLASSLNSTPCRDEKNSTLDDPEFTNESPTSYFSPSSSSHAIPSSASSSPSPPPSFSNLVFIFKSIKTKYNPGHLKDKKWRNVILPWNRCHLSVTKSCPDLLQNREFLPSGWMFEIERKRSVSEQLIYKPYSGPFSYTSE